MKLASIRNLAQLTIRQLKFLLFYPKIGPDMFLTHWLLYMSATRLWFQKRKLKEIGSGSEIRPYVTLNGTDRIIIGRNVVVKPGCIISTSPGNGALIEIEDDVLFGPNVSIYAHDHLYADTSTPIRNQGLRQGAVRVKRGAWLGVNSVILPGVTIGKSSVVGAGAIVTRDVPDGSVVAGNPARIIKHIES